MRKFLLFSWLVMLVFTPLVGRSQAMTNLTELEVDLWPEFDRPSMLVIYKAIISSEATLPVEIKLRIPQAAGAPNAVAARQPDGSLFNIPYELDSAGEWSIVSFTATTPDFQLEYYDPSLSTEGSHRHFEYRWPGDYEVDSLKIQVQEPVGAENMTFSPSLGAGQVAGDGMVYYTQDIGALELGQTFTIVMDYDKVDNSLSAENVPVEPSGPLDTGSSGWQSMGAALPYLLGFIGLGLIIGGGWWYWRSGKKAGTSERPVPRRRKASGDSSLDTKESSFVYCHNCGNRASTGDRFCRSCGTQLRIG